MRIGMQRVACSSPCKRKGILSLEEGYSTAHTSPGTRPIYSLGAGSNPFPDIMATVRPRPNFFPQGRIQLPEPQLFLQQDVCVSRPLLSQQLALLTVGQAAVT